MFFQIARDRKDNMTEVMGNVCCFSQLSEMKKQHMWGEREKMLFMEAFNIDFLVERTCKFKFIDKNELTKQTTHCSI